MSAHDALAQAATDLSSLVDYAYEQGYHEFGYDPLAVLLAAARQSQTTNSVSASSSVSSSDCKRAAVILRNYADPTNVELHELATRIEAMGTAPEHSTGKEGNNAPRPGQIAPVDEKLIADLAEHLSWNSEVRALLVRCRTALASTAPADTAQTYWLIERGSPAEWWVCGSGRGDGTMAHEEWTRDSAKAQRFNECGARKHAKELEQWGVKGPLRATEHIDCDGARADTAARDALQGMLGLIQLIEARDDLTPALRMALLGNHRILAARAVLAASPQDTQQEQHHGD